MSDLTANQHARVEELFSAALEISDVSERRKFLENRCADPEVRREVESLLAAYRSTFLEQPERKFGRYVILRTLAQGGMGIVFEAYDPNLGRLVALKILRTKYASDADVARFQREMRALATLSHQNLVAVHDAGEDRGRAFFVMDRVEGADLSELVKRCGKTRLPPHDACDIARQIASALRTAHTAGYIHRDVKPQNVMLTIDGEVKLLDLGLVRFERAESPSEPLTETAMAMGTPDYMPPEQWLDSHAVDCRADIYSLGCTLYHLLCGEPPFARFPKGDKGRAHQDEDVPSARSLREDVCAELDAVIVRMLAKRPEHRYPTADAVVDALAPFCSGAALGKYREAVRDAMQAGGMERQERGLALLRELCNPLAAEAPTRDHIPPDVQAELDKGDAFDAECRYAEAIAAYETAVTLAQSAGNTHALIKARIELGDTLTREECHLDKAKTVLDACLADLKTHPDQESRGTVLHLLAHIDLCQGRIHEGKSLACEALATARARGSRPQEGRCLIAVAHAEEMAGNLSEALRLLDEAAAIFRVEYRESEGKEKRRSAINLAGTQAMKAAVFEHEGNADEMLASLAEAETLVRIANHSDNLARVLLSKCRALFARSKWDEGLKALEESRHLFERIGSVHWLLKCYDVRAHLAFQKNEQKLALSVCMGAIALAAERGTPEDHVHVLGQTAALCRRNNLDEQAAAFHAEAKRLATEHKLVDSQVDLLLDEANVLRGKDEQREDDEEGKPLVAEALALLESLLVNCQIKGRRAHYMRRIGSLYGRLRNLTEARSWCEQALRTFEEIGDAGGIADSLAMLAAAAREDKDKVAAIHLLEALLDRSKGKPLYHFQAGAHHDLVHLKMSQGDLAGARKHFDAATSICSGYPMPDVEEALRITEKHLAFAERSREAAPRTLPEMLHELHDWVRRYPTESEAILPFWYWCYSAELWSNCRSTFGVKFLVRADTAHAFGRFVNDWDAIGDLFIYAASFALQAQKRFELFPFHLELLIPPHLKSLGLKGPELPPEKLRRVVDRVLDDEPYVLMLFDGKQGIFPGAELFVVGRAYRVPKEIQHLMLATSAEDLIARKLIAMPVRMTEEETSLHHDLCIAWENGLLPVFFGSLPQDKGVTQLREAMLQIAGSGTGNSPEGAAKNKRCLRRFMSEVAGSPDAALEQLVQELDTTHSSSLPVRLKILKFMAGPNEAIQPALVVPVPLRTIITDDDSPSASAAVHPSKSDLGRNVRYAGVPTLVRSVDLPPERSRHIGRNDPCPCGSGKKYKKCCGKRDQSAPGSP